jgi:hypothetical protein
MILDLKRSLILVTVALANQSSQKRTQLHILVALANQSSQKRTQLYIYIYYYFPHQDDPSQLCLGKQE